jgi:transcriptional regulator with XRE-family HTH domain
MATIDMRSLGEYIREQREAAEVSLRQLARSSGVSNPYLSQVERGLKKPSAEILGQIAGALRISAETLYVRAGLLEPRAGSAAVTDAIAADDTISERQRQVLLEIYAAFQSENLAAATRAGDDAETPTTASTGTTTAGARRTTKEES